MTKNESNLIIRAIDELKLQNKEEHAEIVAHQKETNGNVRQNSHFRVSLESQIALIKWMLAFLGSSTIIQVAYLITTHGI